MPQQLLTAISLLFLFCITTSAQTAHVTDPKASFIKAVVRHKELVAATNPRILAAIHDARSCLTLPTVDPPRGRIDIPSRYYSGGHGTINPQESEMSQPYYRIQNLAAQGTNRYLITGSSEESACVLHALDVWARAGTLLNYDPQQSSEAWDQVSWTIGSLALSVSVIQQDSSLDPQQLSEVIDWLHRAAQKAVSEHRSGGTQRINNNNLSYWRGLAATAVGIISNDDQLFTFGLAQYEHAIHQLDDNGSWPLEMERAELALHYEDFAIEPLVMIAELARSQGINLYSYSFHGHNLQNAVSFLFASLDDQHLVQKLSRASQKIEIEIDSDHEYFTWLEFWNLRYPTPQAARYLNRPWYASRLAGSTTLYTAPIACDDGCTLPPAKP